MLERRENQDLLSGDHDINDMNKRLGESRDSSNKKSKLVGTLAAIRYTMLERRENQDLLSGDHDINDMNKRLGESRDSSNKKSKLVGTLAAIRYTLW